MNSLLGKLTPDLVVNCITDIDLDDLHQRGVESLLLDLDNTICEWGSEEIAPERQAWLARAKEGFGICLVSNTIKGRRLRRVAARLEVPAIACWGPGRKPSPGGIMAGLAELQASPGSAAMIGDQVFADVLGGNRAGLYTVWVLPISHREFFATKLPRMLERLIVPRFKRLGLMPDVPSEGEK